MDEETRLAFNNLRNEIMVNRYLLDDIGSRLSEVEAFVSAHDAQANAEQPEEPEEVAESDEATPVSPVDVQPSVDDTVDGVPGDEPDQS